MAIIRNQPISEYFASPNVSSTKLKDFAKSPRLYFDKWVAGTLPGFDDENESKALTFGKYLEAMLCDDIGIFGAALRPKQADAFLVKPEPPDKRADGRTVEGKAWTASAAGKSVVSHKEYKTALRMVQAIAESPEAVGLLRGAEQQVTFTAELHGVTIQSRPDFVSLKGNAYSEFRPYTLDLKTCEDIDRVHNGRQIVDYGYDKQAQLAALGMADHVALEPLHMCLFIEKTIAHRMAIVNLEDWLPDAHNDVAARLCQLAECRATNAWPRQPSGIIRLQAPAWRKAVEWAA